MDQAHFDKCIEHLAIRVGAKCSQDLSYILFAEYELLDNDRFSDACKWLSKNYNGAFNSFPAMPAFEKALHDTKKTKEWKPDKIDKHWENEDVAKAARAVIESLKKKNKIINKL